MAARPVECESIALPHNENENPAGLEGAWTGFLLTFQRRDGRGRITKTMPMARVGSTLGAGKKGMWPGSGGRLHRKLVTP
jgi:hypothetical protein